MVSLACLAFPDHQVRMEKLDLLVPVELLEQGVLLVLLEVQEKMAPMGIPGPPDLLALVDAMEIKDLLAPQDPLDLPVLLAPVEAMACLEMSQTMLFCEHMTLRWMPLFSL